MTCFVSGQGTFGKVYTAINNDTGEIMAMKEIPLQPNDHKMLRSVADELRIFESIHHPHLVKHFGVEIHREEMLIFMEYCPEVRCHDAHNYYKDYVAAGNSGDSGVIYRGWVGGVAGAEVHQAAGGGGHVSA